MKLNLILLIILVLIFVILLKFSYSFEKFENENKDILILIFSCKKYESRIEILKRIGYFKYLKNHNINFLIVTGDEKINSDYKLDLYNNKLLVNVDDTYEGLPHKVIKTFYFINDSPKLNYKFIIKSDDDCLVNIQKILYNMYTIKGEDYIGLLNNYKENYNPNWNGLKNRSKFYGPYMNGATGYILSSKALKSIAKSKDLNSKLLEDELYEDKLIGDILRYNGYKFKKHELWKSLPTNTNKIGDFNKFINTQNNKNITTFFGIQ